VVRCSSHRRSRRITAGSTLINNASTFTQAIGSITARWRHRWHELRGLFLSQAAAALRETKHQILKWWIFTASGLSKVTVLGGWRGW
jgi:hypothetical protein